MKKYGLLGHNISYSLSPKMHNAAFKALAIDAEYQLFDMVEEEVLPFLKALQQNKISGINITVPYKEIAYEFVKTYGVLDPYAQQVGAINTIVISEENIHGYNTDGTGFMRALRDDLEFDVRDKDVLLIGAGGAAKACAVKLAQVCKSLSIFDIDVPKAEELVVKTNNIYKKNNVFLCKNDDQKYIAVEESHLIVNATACGRDGKTSPVDMTIAENCEAVYDLVYDPVKTPLLLKAQEKGCKTSNGLSMLLYQGADAFILWTSETAPVDVMRKACSI
jgi:shikimate dehydrogenase